MLVVLRETTDNRYTLNALTAILDACETSWVTAASPEATADAARCGVRAGRRVLVAYSFMTPHLLGVRGELAVLRREAPGATLLAGGPHPTADPAGTLALGFRHAFVGGAERTLPAFLADPAGAPGVVVDAGSPPRDLDTFSPFGRGRVGPVELTRGCAYGCGFCAVGGRRVRHRSADSVREAGRRIRESGRRRIAFVTPDALNYAGDLAVLDALLAALRTDGLAPVLGTFPSEVRPERVTPEAVAVLARHCQNRTLVIGAQSGSEAVLQRLRRGHSVADVVRAAHTARRAGFRPHVDLIFGLPGETPAARQETRALARALGRETGAKIHAHYFHPLPGTPLWGEDPSPLDDETRRFLRDLRAKGAEDGHWEKQERWAWEILDWAVRGWIRTPRTRRHDPGPRTAAAAGTAPP